MSKPAPRLSVDEDTDSPMHDTDSPSISDAEPAEPTTPNQTLPPTSELSPPDSQTLNPSTLRNEPSPFTPLAGQGSKMPPSQQINENGKRIWEANGQGAGKGAGASASGAGGVMQDTGYKWEKEEDAPGWSWGNPKARDEAARVYQGFVDKDRMIKNKYGDLLLK